MQVTGVVSNVIGVFIAEGKDGKVRILKEGDPIYEGDALYQSFDENLSALETPEGTRPQETAQEATQSSGEENAVPTSAVQLETSPLEAQTSATKDGSLEITLNSGEVKYLTDVGYLMVDTAVLGEDLINTEGDVASRGGRQQDRITGRGQQRGTSHDETADTTIPNNVISIDQHNVNTDSGTILTVTPQSNTPSNTSFNPHQPPRINDLPGKTEFVNAEPIANDDHYEAHSTDSSTVIRAEGNVIHNDIDLDGDLLTVVEVGFEGAKGKPGTAIEGKYGTLIVKEDGTFTYETHPTHPAVVGLGKGETLTESFDYTITDGREVFDSANITFTINGKDDGTPEITSPLATVHEAGLVTGSQTGGVASTVTSTFEFTSPDGFMHGSYLEINEQVFDFETMMSLETAPVTVETELGYLHLTSFDLETNTVTYTYDLKSNLPHSEGDVITDDFAVRVKDGSGEGQELGVSTLTIEIVNDAPIAYDDANEIAENDVLEVSAVNGVLANDNFGADRVDGDAYVTGVKAGSPAHGDLAAGDVGENVAGNYGTLVLNAQGAYEYRPDTTNVLVKGLGTGETLTDYFTYTITDDDGDSSTAELAITINGHDDGTPDVFTSTVSVSESGLDGASGHASAVVTDVFTFTAPNGFIPGSYIIVHDRTLTYEEVVDLANNPVSIDTLKGTIVLDGYGTNPHQVDYTYTLNGNLSHATNEPIDDIIPIKVKDGSGTGQELGEAELVIQIHDDKPEAYDDFNAIGENETLEVPAADGVLFNDVLGADLVALGKNVIGVRAGDSDAGEASGSVGSVVHGQYGTLVLEADGSYTYTPDNSNLLVNGRGDDEELVDTFTYTITDSDGDTATAQLAITINGVDDGVPTITTNAETVHEAGLTNGSASGTNSHIVDGTFTFEAPDGFISGSFINVGGLEHKLCTG